MDVTSIINRTVINRTNFGTKPLLELILIKIKVKGSEKWGDLGLVDNPISYFFVESVSCNLLRFSVRPKNKFDLILLF